MEAEGEAYLIQEDLRKQKNMEQEQDICLEQICGEKFPS